MKDFNETYERNKKKPQSKQICLVDADPYDSDLPFKFEGSLQEFIAALVKILESIPVEYQSSVIIDIDSTDEYDYHKPTINIYYQRLETEKEMNERLRQEERIFDLKISQERREYQRLKKKFEDEPIKGKSS